MHTEREAGGAETPPVVKVEVKLSHPKAKLPHRGRGTDAGYDIYCIEDAEVAAGRTATVDTGLHLSVPPGFYYTIEGRSSLYKRRIVPYRAIIDSTYTGPLVVHLQNFSNHDYLINDGDRVAQLLLHRVLDMRFSQVPEFSPTYNQRGVNGYGSTGR